MSESTYAAFRRTLPRRLWLHGPGRGVTAWSVLAGISLALLLVTLALTLDVLATRGEVEAGGDALLALRRQLIGITVPQLPEEAEDAGQMVRFGDAGILPAIVKTQSSPLWRSLLGGAYRALPQLRQNVTAVTTLTGGLVTLGIILAVSLARVRAGAFRAASGIVATLRKSIHRQTLRLGPGDLSGQSQQQAEDLFLKVAERVGDGAAEWIRTLPSAVMMTVVLLALAVSVDWRLMLQCLVPLAGCWWLMHFERGRGAAAHALATARVDAELRRLAESLRKTRIVRSYSMEEFEHGVFEKHLQRFTDGIATGQHAQTRAIWLSLVLGALSVGLVWYMISLRVLATGGPLPIYAAALLALVFATLVPCGNALLKLPLLRRDVNVEADKIYRYLNRIPEVGQAVGAKFLEPLSRSIAFESVGYRLDGTAVLQEFDLRLAAGSMTAVVSPDPLQAQAVAYLLPRFIEPHAGRVLFDGEDINWATLESLRAEAIYVGGADPSFTGTVLENITCGQPEYSLQHATEAAKLVHAHKFIAALPQGYETVLGEHGERLDPGKAFRLSLARAVLRKPALMIIEEPLATLDEDTKALLDDAYSRLRPQRTLVLLPTRLSTVRKCDQVVLVNKGRVEGVGPHQELLKKSEVYRHWEYITFNAFRRQADVEGRAAS